MIDNNKTSKLKAANILDPLSTWFEQDSSWDSNWRDNAKKWYSYYHGNQWTDEEVSVLEQRGQAVLTFNHIKPAIDSIIGSERQNRPKVTMAGRTLDDDRIAQVKTSLYNYIQDNSLTDDEIDKVIKDTLIAGRGWILVHPEEEGSEVNLKHTYLDYRDVFVDSMSRRDDLSDCRRLHYAVYTDSDIVSQMFPKYKEEVRESSDMFAGSSEDDMWFEKSDRNRPRLINTWYRDEKGDMNTVIWVKGQILYYKKVPYDLDSFPLVQITADRDLNNTPYGIVRTMISAQDEVNKRHSKALHYLNSSQVLAEDGAFTDWDEAVKTLARPDGITKLQDGALSEGRVMFRDNASLANTHISLLELAKGEILGTAGLNAASLGQGSQYESAKKSGMSIAQAQTTLVPVLNKIRIGRHRLAKITMGLVPKFYSEERAIRIVNTSGSYEFMSINQVVLLDDGTINKLFDVTNDDIDIMIEDAPRGLNEKEEQFNQLLTIQGQTSKPIPMDILLRYSSLKDKHQLAKEIKDDRAVESQMTQVQQYAQQLEAQVQKLGGVINQQKSQLIQISTARAVDKEVSKAKVQIEKELGSL